MTDNKKVQDLTMNTLNILINYCEEHDLMYYFTGGACSSPQRLYTLG